MLSYKSVSDVPSAHKGDRKWGPFRSVSQHRSGTWRCSLGAWMGDGSPRLPWQIQLCPRTPMPVDSHPDSCPQQAADHHTQVVTWAVSLCPQTRWIQSKQLALSWRGSRWWYPWRWWWWWWCHYQLVSQKAFAHCHLRRADFERAGDNLETERVKPSRVLVTCRRRVTNSHEDDQKEEGLKKKNEPN